MNSITLPPLTPPPRASQPTTLHLLQPLLNPEILSKCQIPNEETLNFEPLAKAWRMLLLQYPIGDISHLVFDMTLPVGVAETGENGKNGNRGVREGDGRVKIRWTTDSRSRPGVVKVCFRRELVRLVNTIANECLMRVNAARSGLGGGGEEGEEGNGHQNGNLNRGTKLKFEIVCKGEEKERGMRDNFAGVRSLRMWLEKLEDASRR